MTADLKYSEELISPKNWIVRAAGLLYLLIIVIGVLNSVFINARLIDHEDINLTINNIAANEFLFRVGIFCELILYVLVIILSVLLYLILKNVNKNLALTAMVFRAGEGLLGAAVVLTGFIVLDLLNNQYNMASTDNAQMSYLIGALLSARANGLYIVLLLIGIGGTLFYKSSYIPGILSVWGIFTYLSMLVLSLISILFPEHPNIIEIFLYGSGALFELTIGLWLLIRGINLNKINKHIERQL
jgi:hypothetical protein